MLLSVRHLLKIIFIHGLFPIHHADYAGPFLGKHYLIIVDALSKWPEIFETNTSTSSKTIKLMIESFARFGLPETLVTDNGTQFVSETFCKEAGINHIKTPKHHPQSNGQAERFVDTFKRAMKEINCKTSDESWQTFLSFYRTTPNPSTP